VKILDLQYNTVGCQIGYRFARLSSFTIAKSEILMPLAQLYASVNEKRKP
jgi:hypothetical protein